MTIWPSERVLHIRSPRQIDFWLVKSYNYAGPMEASLLSHQVRYGIGVIPRSIWHWLKCTMAATGCLTKLEPYPYSNLPAVHVFSLFVTSYQYLSNEINHTIYAAYELYQQAAQTPTTTPCRTPKSLGHPKPDCGTRWERLGSIYHEKLGNPK